MGHPSIRISFGDLAVTRATAKSNQRLPLSELAPEDDIHGDLCIEVQGRRLPGLGYFGVNDVCFPEWLGQLAAVRAAFSGSLPARYVFDEGEQGQPAFVFEREDDLARVTIADAEFSGGVADPDWQRVPFSAEEFLAEEARFRHSFLDALRAAAPRSATAWIARWRRRTG